MDIIAEPPSASRRVVNILCLLAVVAALAGGGYYGHGYMEQRRQVRDVAGELRRFQQVLSFQAASEQTEVNSRGWPVTVDPEWFGDGLPANRLLTPDRPWVEIATREQADLTDPPVRLAVNRSVASFWYNPYRGIVRARVPVLISDEKALELYNAVNGTRLTSIYGGQSILTTAAPAEDADHDADAQSREAGDGEAAGRGRQGAIVVEGQEQRSR